MVSTRFLSKTKDYGELVMFSHSLYSLPFGIVAMFWAYGGLPPGRIVFFILLALFSARLGANAFNRIADRVIDGKNPRTANRHLQTGKVKLIEAYIIFGICAIGIIVSAFMINATAVVLLPVAGIIILGYSYTKRFTWMCNFILGIACACAPLGAWIAIKGSASFNVPVETLLFGWVSPAPVVLAMAVTFYVGGFDIVYAIQDIEVDRKEGIYSFPGRFGCKISLIASGLSHFAAALFLFSLYFIMGLGLIYIAAVGIMAFVLFMQNYTAYKIYYKKEEACKSSFFATYNVNRTNSACFLIFALLDMFV